MKLIKVRNQTSTENDDKQVDSSFPLAYADCVSTSCAQSHVASLKLLAKAREIRG